MKKLIIFVAMLATCGMLDAQAFLQKAIPAGTITNVLKGPFRISKLTFVSSNTNTDANDLTFFYDNRNSSSNLVYAAFYAPYETNITYTNIYTNSVGIITTNYFAAISNVYVSNAATTTAAPLLTVISTLGPAQPVGRNGSALNTTYGMTIQSSTAGTVYITYGPAF